VEAEVVRDSILAISGELNLKKGGPGVYVDLPKEVLHARDGGSGGWGPVGSQAEQNRRSVYIFVKRSLLVPMLEAFDYNTPSSPVAVRSVTTVSPQALMLLNDGFVRKQGAALADRLEREAWGKREKEVGRAFELVVQRRASEREMKLAMEMIGEQEGMLKARGLSEAEARRGAMRNFCVAMLNLNEMVYVD
jgi:hypothetical protein